jgi:uncharacterized protein
MGRSGDFTMTATTILVLGVLFFSTLVRSALGFGEALIAVPLLALVIPIQSAVPIAVLVSITVAAIVLLQDWQHVQVRSAGWLVVSTLVGIPLGLLLLTRISGSLVKACLGVIIIGFSGYALLYRRPVSLRDDRLAWAFGLGAGVLGGAYGMNGPPLVIYGTLRGWSPQRFRATLQGYFLPASVVSMGAYWLAGLWKADVTHYYLMALPGVLVATFLGRAVNERMNAQAFVRYMYLGLLIVAAVLLVQSLR